MSLCLCLQQWFIRSLSYERSVRSFKARSPHSET